MSDALTTVGNPIKSNAACGHLIGSNDVRYEHVNSPGFFLDETDFICFFRQVVNRSIIELYIIIFDSV